MIQRAVVPGKRKTSHCSGILIAAILCVLAVSNGYAQFHIHIHNDTTLLANPDNVVRVVNPEKITFTYYFDVARTKVRNEYVYFVDKTDNREVIFIRGYCWSGKKAMEQTLKNYNRKVKQIDTAFMIPRELIAGYGMHADDFDDSDFPFKEYSHIGASVYWYCNGQISDSVWLYPTKHFKKVSSGKSTRFRTFVWIKKVYTESNGTEYSWYESGNLNMTTAYKNNRPVEFISYFDSLGKISGITKYVSENGKKQATYISKSYYENGQLRDSVVHDSKTNEYLKRYEFNKNGSFRYVTINLPDFVVFEAYKEDGKPMEVNRKARYKNKWYSYSEKYYDNNQLMSYSVDRIFLKLHPEYGSMPDSIEHIAREYRMNGNISFERYELSSGERRSSSYRLDGSLEKEVICTADEKCIEIEYPEKK